MRVRAAPSTRQAGARRSARDDGWPYAWIVAAVLLGVLSVRLAELLPLVPRLKPAVLSVVLLLPLTLLRAGNSTRSRALGDRTVILLLCYAAWAAVTVPFALWKGQAFSQLMLLPFAMAVVVAVLLVAPTQRMLDRLAVSFLCIVAATGALAYLRGQTMSGRLTTGASFDPNDLASVMVVALPFALAHVLRGPSRMRVLGGVTACIIALVIMATGSRGGMIGVVACLVVFTAGMKFRRAFAAALLIAVSAPVAWHVAPPTFRDQLRSMGNLEADYNMTEDYGRIATWKRGIGYGLANPIVGVGMGNFGMAEGERLRSMGIPGHWFTAHNTYVQVFAEMGLPGALLFLALLFRAARQAGRFWRSDELHRPEYAAALAGFCAAAIFLSHAYAYHLFGLLGIIAHAGIVADRELAQPGRSVRIARGRGIRPRVGRSSPADHGPATQWRNP